VFLPIFCIEENPPSKMPGGNAVLLWQEVIEAKLSDLSGSIAVRAGNGVLITRPTRRTTSKEYFERINREAVKLVLTLPSAAAVGTRGSHFILHPHDTMNPVLDGEVT